MDRSDVITLVSAEWTRNDQGVQTQTETTKDVFCNVSSVTRTEWFEGGRNGLNPAYRFTMFRYDYSDEATVIYNGVRYAVYRTYETQNDQIELYVQKESGA